jgi:hypothetical protein
MNTESFPAVDLNPGDCIHYRDLDVTVIGDSEPLENPFGLPWFKYLVEADGKRGYVKFGPSGTVLKYI